MRSSHKEPVHKVSIAVYEAVRHRQEARTACGGHPYAVTSKWAAVTCKGCLERRVGK